MQTRDSFASPNLSCRHCGRFVSMEKPRSAFGGASSMRALVDASHLACAATVNRRFERKKHFSVAGRSLLRLPVTFPAQYAQRRGGTIAKPNTKRGFTCGPCLLARLSF